MYDSQSLSHTIWECKYHLVWIPKWRKKIIYGELRKYLGEIFRELAKQKECNVIEGHLRDLQFINIPFIMSSNIKPGGFEHEDIDSEAERSNRAGCGLDWSIDRFDSLAGQEIGNGGCS